MLLEYVGLLVFVVIGILLYKNFTNGKDAPFVPVKEVNYRKSDKNPKI